MRRRLQWIDWLLIGTLLPAWGVALGLHVHAGLVNGCASLPFLVGSAPRDGHPVVAWVRPEARGSLERGDRLLRLGESDLRGATALGFLSRAYSEARRSGSVLLETERAGERRELRVHSVPTPFRGWSTVPFGVALALTALVLLVRARRWRLRRRFFVAALSQCLFVAFYRSLGGPFTLAWGLTALVATPVAVGLALESSLEWVGVARNKRRSLSGAAAVGCIALGIWGAFLPAPAPGLVLSLYNALFVGTLGGFLALAIVAYRRAGPLEQRQARWVVLGLYVGLLPLAFAAAAELTDTLAPVQPLLFLVARLASVAIPLGLLAAVFGSDLLDVDRLLSSAASYNVLAIVLLGAALALLPSAAALLSERAGIGETGSQVALSLALACLAVPGHRALRPRLDRLLFPEHHALEQGMAGLLGELARPGSPAELVRRTAVRLAELLRPDSLAVYSREGPSFAPVFERGAASLPPLPARSPLVAALEARAAPLAAPAWSERGPVRPDAFERAALDTLGAALVLPVRRGDALAAFVALGPKRSGDVYTATDLALLAALGARLSEAFERIDEAELLRGARALQAELRRYVPGAVAERVVRGETLEPGEREVTVLFVDLRGYTRLSEGLQPSEIFSAVNRYTERVSALVAAHGGSVVEFHGDGLLAVFGAPEALERKERAAVEAARETLDAVAALAREDGSPPLAVGVGIATGPAFVGNVRGHDREIWTVLGNPTNLAARLQSMTRELGASIAIDAPTRAAAGYVCADFVPRPALAIRGRSEPVDAWVLPVA